MIESICRWSTAVDISRLPSAIPQILIAHRNHEARSALKRALLRVGYGVVDCDSSTDFDRLLAEPLDVHSVAEIDLVICEAELLSGRALDAVARRQDQGAFPPLILMGHRRNGCSEVASKLRPVAVFTELFATRAQLAAIRKLVPHRRPIRD